MKRRSTSEKGHWLSLRRRRIQLVLAGLFVLAGLYVASGSGLLISFGSSNQAYLDVPPSHYAYGHVQRLAAEDILEASGCPTDKHFCPGHPFDRQTAAVWLIRMAMDESILPHVSNSRFSDVDDNDWKTKYIEELARREITSGCGDDENGNRKFCPENNVLRKHMAIFIFRAFDLPAGPDASFEDVRSGDTYFESINALAAIGITVGCGDGTNFCPDRTITRAQAAIMLGRVLEWRDGPAEPGLGPEDTTSPVITVDFDPQDPALTARANEQVSNWAYIGPLHSGACANNLFGRGTRPGSSVALDSRDAGKWYCFRAKDSANNWGFGSEQVPADAFEDKTAPKITVGYNRQQSALVAQADEPVAEWSYVESVTESACEIGAPHLGITTTVVWSPGNSVVITYPEDNDKLYCFKAVDAAGVVGFGWGRAPEHIPVPGDYGIVVFRSGSQMTVRASDDRPIRWSEKQVDEKPASCRDVSFPSGAAAYIGSHTVMATDEQQETYYCFKGIDESGTVAHSLPELVDYLAPRISFDFSDWNKYVIVEDISVSRDHVYYVVLEDDSSGDPCAQARYSSSIRFRNGLGRGRDSSFKFGVNDYVGMENPENHGKYLCVKAIDDNRYHANTAYASHQITIDDRYTDASPPRIELQVDGNEVTIKVSDSQSDIKSGSFGWFWLIDANADTVCGVHTASLKFNETADTIEVHPGYDGDRICVKAENNANLSQIQRFTLHYNDAADDETDPVDYWAENCTDRDDPAPLDSIPEHGWCIEDDDRNRLVGASSKRGDDNTATNSDSPVDPPIPTPVSQTETLETLALIRGEDRVLLAQAQLQVADTVINDTWESVALTEDASCDETAFEDTDAINQGSEVADPQTDTQYCFRAEDSEGATHYIAALVTDDSFSGLDAAGPGTGGPIRGVMLIVVAIASIVGIGLIVVIITFVSQKRTPKFR